MAQFSQGKVPCRQPRAGSQLATQVVGVGEGSLGQAGGGADAGPAPLLLAGPATCPWGCRASGALCLSQGLRTPAQGSDPHGPAQDPISNSLDPAGALAAPLPSGQILGERVNPELCEELQSDPPKKPQKSPLSEPLGAELSPGGARWLLPGTAGVVALLGELGWPAGGGRLNGSAGGSPGGGALEALRGEGFVLPASPRPSRPPPQAPSGRPRSSRQALPGVGRDPEAGARGQSERLLRARCTEARPPSAASAGIPTTSSATRTRVLGHPWLPPSASSGPPLASLAGGVHPPPGLNP